MRKLTTLRQTRSLIAPPDAAVRTVGDCLGSMPSELEGCARATKAPRDLQSQVTVRAHPFIKASSISIIVASQRTGLRATPPSPARSRGLRSIFVALTTRNPRLSVSRMTAASRRRIPRKIPHTSAIQTNQTDSKQRVCLDFQDCTNRNNDPYLALNQQVPGSNPGRRTKVVNLYGLTHPNGRADRTTD